MNKDIADFAVDYALKLGASYAEARLEYTEDNGFVLKNGTIDLSAFERNKGIGIRTIKDGVLGFVSTDRLDNKDIKNLIKNSIKNQKKSSRLNKQPLNFSKNETIKAKDIVKQKKKIENISPEEKLSFVLDIEKKIDKSIVPFRHFSLSNHYKKKYFINSEGTKIYSEIPYINFFYIMTIKENNNTMQRYWQYGNCTGWESTKQWKVDENILSEIKNLRNLLKKGVRAPNKNLDIVVGPEVTGIICHESVGHPYEADRIFGREAAQGGESFVTKSMIGKKISNPIVNVVDEPNIEGYPGYYKYDDEGVKARRKYLIKKGKINELLHNRETSLKLNLKSNASARASSYNKEPIIRMSNTIMLPGDYNEDEIFEDIKFGVYIKNFGEWNIDDKRSHQRYVSNEAYLIEKGKITVPVKNAILELSTLKLWSSIDAISKKNKIGAATCGKGEPMQGIRVGLGGPKVRLRNIKLG